MQHSIASERKQISLKELSLLLNWYVTIYAVTDEEDHGFYGIYLDPQIAEEYCVYMNKHYGKHLHYDPVFLSDHAPVDMN